jgi:hypothetical protein
MDFFNSPLIRITLAVIGGIFYAFLTYMIVMFLNLSYEFAIVAAVFVYLFYLSSRLLLLFSGTPPIIQKEGKGLPKHPQKKILSTPLLNGLENSITIMTSYFSFFWASSPFSFSSPLPWMDWKVSPLEIPFNISGMPYCLLFNVASSY